MARPKSDTQRKQAERDRNRAEGWKLKQVWVHGDDEARLLRLVERLNKRRGK